MRIPGTQHLWAQNKQAARERQDGAAAQLWQRDPLHASAGEQQGTSSPASQAADRANGPCIALHCFHLCVFLLQLPYFLLARRL